MSDTHVVEESVEPTAAVATEGSKNEAKSRGSKWAVTAVLATILVAVAGFLAYNNHVEQKQQQEDLESAQNVGTNDAIAMFTYAIQQERWDFIDSVCSHSVQENTMLSLEYGAKKAADAESSGYIATGEQYRDAYTEGFKNGFVASTTVCG